MKSITPRTTAPMPDEKTNGKSIAITIFFILAGAGIIGSFEHGYIQNLKLLFLKEPNKFLENDGRETQPGIHKFLENFGREAQKKVADAAYKAALEYIDEHHDDVIHVQAVQEVANDAAQKQNKKLGHILPDTTITVIVIGAVAEAINTLRSGHQNSQNSQNSLGFHSK